jgi:two-component system sensor histidine kinase KdpD
MNYLKTSLRCAAIAAVMVALTSILGSISDVSPGTMALSYLTVVLLVATLWHVRLGLFASATAALCFAYFLPPAHSFQISSARNWIVLGAFIATAVTASFLSNRIQSEAAVANRRRQEMERLYSLSQRMLKVGNVADLLQSIPRSIAISFQLASTTLYVADQDRVFSNTASAEGGDSHALLPLDTMRAAMDQPIATLQAPPCTLVPLLAGLRPIGLLVLTGEIPAQETLEAIGGLVTMSIIRSSAMEDVARSQAGRENEWMRSVLMDSASREMQLPLVEIESSVHELLAQPPTPAQLQAATARILASTANLKGLIDQVVTMAQQQPDELRLQLRPCSMRDLIEEVLAARGSVTRQHPIKLDLLQRSHRVQMDPGWISEVLGYLLDNAAKYSPAGEVIAVDSEVRGNKLVVSVVDRGIGIDPAEHALIFKRFYRGARQPDNTSGAGLGLPIARAIVEAHGGALEVSSRPGCGSAFSFSLPLVAE